MVFGYSSTSKLIQPLSILYKKEEKKGEERREGDKEEEEERNPLSRWDFVGGFLLVPLLPQLVDPVPSSAFDPPNTGSLCLPFLTMGLHHSHKEYEASPYSAARCSRREGQG